MSPIRKLVQKALHRHRFSLTAADSDCEVHFGRRGGELERAKRGDRLERAMGTNEYNLGFRENLGKCLSRIRIRIKSKHLIAK